jgi:integrase
LYRNTGDIYIVADVLGHKDVNTTRRHYAAITDDLRRKASTKVSIFAPNGDDEGDNK